MDYTSREVYEFISKQTNPAASDGAGDPIVEWKTCIVSGQSFAIFQSDLDFYKKISPTFAGQKFQIPTPTLCPEERQRRRMLFRNDHHMYKRVSNGSHKEIISLYSPDKDFIVYEPKYRRSDKRNPLDYGIEFNLSKTFTEQFKTLYNTVPRISMMNDDGLGTSDNCAYCHDFAFGKNSYLVTATRYIENGFYSDCVLYCKNICDCMMLDDNCDHLYQSMYSTNCQNCMYIDTSTSSHHCQFCYGIVGCSYCYGCVGLQNKSYCIFNKQYTKEEYEIQVAKIIAHMQETGERGEFFHPSLSPFGYNETVAQEYFPLSREETLGRGYTWSDYSSDPKIPAGAILLTGDQIPSDIATVTDDIIKQVIICEISKRPFMIQKAELEFYRKHNLPLPRKHPDVRHEERMKLRPGRTLYLRNCDKCNKEMLSVYPVIANTTQGSVAIHNQGGSQDIDRFVPRDDNEKVYCESCYQQEVFA